MDMGDDNSSHDNALLKQSDVRKWQETKANLEKRIAADTSEVARLTRLLDAAAVLTGETASEESAATPEPRFAQKPPSTLPEVILFILDISGRPMTQPEIRSALPEEWQERIRKAPNYFYTALIRMVRRGTVVREGDYISLPKN